MKRIVFAGLVALALTTVSQQKASAWGWQLSGSWSIGLDFKCWCDCPQAAPCWANSGYGCATQAYAAPAYAYNAGGYAPAPAYATAPQAQPAAVAVQPVGYYYYGNYGYGQAPSYWYGR